MKKKKEKSNVWGLKTAEFMDDAIVSAREGLFSTDDLLKNEQDEREYAHRLLTIAGIFTPKTSDIIQRGLRAKTAPAKGGGAKKELKGILKAIKMILPKAEKTDAFSLFNHFVKCHKGVESALNIPIKEGVCKVFAMMGKDKKGKPRAMIYQILGVSDEDLDDRTLQGIVLPTFRRYVRKAKQK
jgi:hypothetical protein